MIETQSFTLLGSTGQSVRLITGPGWVFLELEKRKKIKSIIFKIQLSKGKKNPLHSIQLCGNSSYHHEKKNSKVSGTHTITLTDCIMYGVVYKPQISFSILFFYKRRSSSLQKDSKLLPCKFFVLDGEFYKKPLHANIPPHPQKSLFII